MELHDVSYGIEYGARPLLLFFSFENRLLWFRYREYDLAHLKLIFEFSIYKVWKLVEYGVFKGMAYCGFLGVGTTFDIFENIILYPYLEYGVLSLSGYGVWNFIPFVVFDFRLFQMDVKSAFLNGFINGEVYVAQPPGFIDFVKPNDVYRLKKALYGLKQAPKSCFEGPSDTKENRIMDLKFEYQTFRAKSTESISQTYTRYKTLLNELANDSVKLSKHEINIFIEVTETFNWDEEEVSNDEEVTQVKVLMALADDEPTVRKSHARNGEWVDITIRKVERLNPDSKLLNFNTGRILVPESQVVNESLKPTEASTNPESSNDYEAEPITPLPLLNILQGASLSLEDSSNKSVSRTVIVSKTKQTTSLIPTEVKDTEQE
ncbi:retrovirus-related pol polyprotein from transposon TNT 1-94 [Tanacetum coccineum]